MSGDIKALAARGEAKLAQADLLANVELLKARLSPSVLVGDAVERARRKSSDLLEDANDTIRRNPETTGAIGIVAALFVVVTLWRRRRPHAADHATPADDMSLNHQRASRPEKGLPS